MRPCLFPTFAFALWRVGSNSRGNSDPQAEAWHESGLVITTKLGKPVDPRNFYRAFRTGEVGPACLRRRCMPPAWPAHRASLPLMSTEVYRPLSITTRRHRCCTLLLHSSLWQLIRVAKVSLTKENSGAKGLEPNPCLQIQFVTCRLVRPVSSCAGHRLVRPVRPAAASEVNRM
jgi:hypothetical protein